MPRKPQWPRPRRPPDVTSRVRSARTRTSHPDRARPRSADDAWRGRSAAARASRRCATPRRRSLRARAHRRRPGRRRWTPELPPNVPPRVPGRQQSMISARPGDTSEREARRDALGGEHEIGHHTESLAREPGPRAAEAGLDLIRDEHDAVAGAPLLQCGQVSRRQGTTKPPSPWMGSAIRAARSVTPMRCSRWSIVRLRRLFSGESVAVRVRVRYAVDVGSEGTETGAVRRLVVHGEGEVRAPVEGVVECGEPARRPVCLRAILTAFSTASAPELAKKERFSCSPGVFSARRSASRTYPS